MGALSHLLQIFSGCGYGRKGSFGTFDRVLALPLRSALGVLIVFAVAQALTLLRTPELRKVGLRPLKPQPGRCRARAVGYVWDRS